MPRIDMIGINMNGFTMREARLPVSAPITGRNETEMQRSSLRTFKDVNDSSHWTTHLVWTHQTAHYCTVFHKVRPGFDTV